VSTQVLGIGQLDWVSEVLKANYDAPLVFVAIGSQVLNQYEAFENMARYPDERLELLRRCAQFPGQVVFLTGDRHHGEIEDATFHGKRFIEVCSSPLTSKVFAPSSLEASVNTTIRGNPVNQKHFTVIKVSKKKLHIEYFTSKGETIVNASYEL
jgi:alkaline phosphatase D